jgi:hypothetical protein
MGRPLYETDADRARQRHGMRLLQRRLKCRAVEQPRKSRHDWELRRDGRLWSLAEFKARWLSLSHPMIRAQGVYLARQKYEPVLAEARLRCCQFHFFIWCHDGIAGAVLPPDVLEFKKDTGRTVRTRDAGDIEECLMVPANHFKVLLTPRETGPLPERRG